MKAIRPLALFAIGALLALTPNARAVDQTGFNTDFGFANDVTNAFNSLFGGAFNAVHGSNNTLFGGAWNLTAGSQLTTGTNAYWTFNGGNTNTTLGQLNFLWGKGLSDGGVKGAVVLSDSDPFSLRVPPAPAPPVPLIPINDSFVASFSNGYFLFTDDSQGANSLNGLIVSPSGINTANQTFLAAVGINRSPTATLDVGSANQISGGGNADVRIGLSNGAHLAIDSDEIQSAVGLPSAAFPAPLGINANGGDVQLGFPGGTGRLVVNTAFATVGAFDIITARNIQVNGVTVTSDREKKREFAPVDGREVLDTLAGVEIQTWRYLEESGDKARHIGPVAQEFYGAFGFGQDDKHIDVVDAQGVALAAIQGLNEKFEAQLSGKDARIEELENSQAQLEARLAKLEKLLENSVE